MKKVALLILFIVLLIGTGVVSADPKNNPTADTIVELACDDGFSGNVLVPAFLVTRPKDLTAMGFFNDDIDGSVGLGRPRKITITLPGPTVIELLNQPGQGYETVACWYWEGPAFVELDVQRISTRN